MKYLLLIYESEASWDKVSGGRAAARSSRSTWTTRTSIKKSGNYIAGRGAGADRHRHDRPRARTARRSPPTGRSRRRASSSAGSTWSRRRTSTRRSSSPRGSPPRAPARSRCGRSCRRPARVDCVHHGPPGGLHCRAGPWTSRPLYREERPRALATLIRLLGDFDLAEEMLQEAFAAALVQWPRDGAAAKPARLARLRRRGTRRSTGCGARRGWPRSRREIASRGEPARLRPTRVTSPARRPPAPDLHLLPSRRWPSRRRSRSP